MAHRLRLTLVVLLLVVLPTAVLSLLAGRALHASELFLRRELEIAALSEVEVLAEEASAAVQSGIAAVREALAGAEITSGAYELAGMAQPLERESDLIAAVFVFVNPWGFIYPTAVPDELTALLRRRIASSPGQSGPLAFSNREQAYCFARIREDPAMYAGFQADSDALAFELVEALERRRQDNFFMEAVRADGIRFRAGAEQGSVVIVDDPFGGPAFAPPALASDAMGEEQAFVSVRLKPPLDAYTVAVYLRDPGGLKASEELRARVTAWGILVLALGVCAGAWIVVREAVIEIRRARSRSDLVLGISHDLRTPVSAMKMLAETLYLDRVPDAAKRKEFLGTIARECERLNHLVERVLFFVRFGQRALHYALQEADPEQLARRAVGIFAARFEGAPAPAVPDVRVEAAAGLPAVRVDESAMTQVLLNLLDNAEKYSRNSKLETGTPDGNPLRPPPDTLPPTRCTRHVAPDTLPPPPAPVRIDVVLEVVRRFCLRPGCVRAWVRIAVRDYGAGMERRVARKVFREFYRGPGAADRNVSGLGLGLALCRHVVAAHGGRMRLASAPGRGSTFEVWLPAR